MYERFYGLSEHPFSLTPDPDFLFLNETFQNSLDQITYAIDRRETFSVLIGDVGTGKTTLCRALLLRLPATVRTALILNPLVDIDDLFRMIIQDFQIKPRSRLQAWHARTSHESEGLQDPSWLNGLTRKELIDELNRFLLEGARDDVRNLLIIDEAQNLSTECLEHLRILSNLETSKRKLLQVVFSGQIELDDKLNLTELRQLKQRITVRCSLQPLSEHDMVRYIHHRLWKAGSNGLLTFSKSALKRIYKHSRGYPRLINIICDRALMEGCNERSQNITNKIAKAAIGKMAMRKAKTASRPSLFSVKLMTAAIGKLAMHKAKTASRPSLFSVKLMAAAIAALLVLGGIAYHFWTRIEDGISAAYHEMINPESAKAETELSETEKPHQDQPDSQSLVPAVSSTLPPSGPSFSLQVHSLKTQERADHALAELKAKGYAGYTRVFVNPDSTRWYVVFIGPFANAEAAKETAETIRQREQLPSVLRTYSSAEALR